MILGLVKLSFLILMGKIGRHATKTANTHSRYLPRLNNKEEKELKYWRLQPKPRSFDTPGHRLYANTLSLACFGASYEQVAQGSVLDFSPKKLSAKQASSVIPSPLTSSRKNTSKYQIENVTILDAPNLVDDFYAHPLDWTLENHLFISLANKVYHYNVHKKQSNELQIALDTPNINYNLVAIEKDSKRLLLSLKNRNILYYHDISASKKSSYLFEDDFITAHVQTNTNTHMIAGFHGTVRLFDSRAKSLSFFKQLNREQICNLSFNNEYIIAAGTSQNNIYTWDLRQPRQNLCQYPEHRATVRALAFHRRITMP
jgi:WD40 repeat protein